jgi:hydrogenase maturation protease
VVGLGNPLLGDDGVGWRVVDALERRLAEAAPPGRLPPLELDRVAVGGFGLMERLVGSERAILVDACDAGPDPPGTVAVLLADDVPALSGHLDGAHDASLRTALDAGRALGAPLPAEIVVVAVRADRVDTFGERLSPEVERAVPTAVDAILAVAREGMTD